VFVVCCACSGLCDELIIRSGKSYWVYVRVGVGVGVCVCVCVCLIVYDIETSPASVA